MVAGALWQPVSLLILTDIGLVLTRYGKWANPVRIFLPLTKAIP